MRAYTIVLFILAIHACLAMINVANITDIGLNVSLDTSTKGGILVIPGSGITVPSSDPMFFDQCATAPNASNTSALIDKKDFGQNMIESIVGVGVAFVKFMATFSNAIFSIHKLGAPIFGDYNAWILEGIVDTVFGVSLFQMVTGRSFKTME